MPTEASPKQYRVLQIWTLLVFAAKKQQILGYKELSSLTGLPMQSLGDYLGPIKAYTAKKKLPPLHLIVVKQETGLPEGGLAHLNITGEGGILAQQSRTFVFDWASRTAPKPEEFSNDES